jgi:flagellar assembly factor FliW
MSTMTGTATRVSFIEPLPGFEGEDYTLDPIDENGLLYSLRSVDAPDLRFVLAAAPAFFPGYLPAISSTLAGPLGADEVDLLLVLTVGSGLQDATANLRAPVALARTTGRAVQVILDDEDLSMREPLLGH